VCVTVWAFVWAFVCRHLCVCICVGICVCLSAVYVVEVACLRVFVTVLVMY
jgi:hypothetical protein